MIEKIFYFDIHPRSERLYLSKRKVEDMIRDWMEITCEELNLVFPKKENVELISGTTYDGKYFVKVIMNTREKTESEIYVERLLKFLKLNGTKINS